MTKNPMQRFDVEKQGDLPPPPMGKAEATTHTHYVRMFLLAFGFAVCMGVGVLVGNLSKPEPAVMPVETTTTTALPTANIFPTAEEEALRASSVTIGSGSGSKRGPDALGFMGSLLPVRHFWDGLRHCCLSSLTSPPRPSISSDSGSRT